MGELIDLNSTIPASRIDTLIATDAEFQAADAAERVISDAKYAPLRPIGIEFAESPGSVNFIDFHTHSIVKDFDVRLIGSGGGSTSGLGTLLLQAGLFQVNSPYSLNGGAILTRRLSTIASIDMPSIAAGAVAQNNQNITGAVIGDLALFIPLTMPAGLPFFNIQAIISATGVATIYFHNLSSGAIDLPSFSGRLLVLGFS